MLLLAACAAPSDSVAASTPTCTAPAGDVAVDDWGGDTRVTLPATGFFGTTRLCGRAWFVDPDGHPFYATGANAVTRTPSASQVTGISDYTTTVDATYASPDDWADTQVERLRSWGLTSIGAWSDTDLYASRMPTAVILYVSGGDWETGSVTDWWSPDWTALVESRVAAAVQPDNPWILGYFLDNEMRWGPDWRGDDTLLELYLALGADAPGKAVAVDALYARHGDLDGLNAALGTTFASRDEVLAATDGWSAVRDDDTLVSTFLTTAAERYFSTTTDTVRAADPNHLVLGNRESAPVTRAEVYETSAAYVDVLSINDYVYVDGIVEAARALSGAVDPSGFVAELAPDLDVPFLVSEFGFRAADSGLPNTWPPLYPVYDTQADRADALQAYAEAAQAAPWVLGYHWFEYVDEPADGRFDGEDNNWGLVDAADQPYAVVVDRMTQVNGGISALLTVE